MNALYLQLFPNCTNHLVDIDSFDILLSSSLYILLFLLLSKLSIYYLHIYFFQILSISYYLKYLHFHF